MSDFRWRHYQGGIILGYFMMALYGISYRELEEMILKRGLEVDHTTNNINMLESCLLFML